MLLFVPPLWKQEKDYNLKKTFSDSPSGDWLTLFHRHFLTWNYVTAWPQWPCAAWKMDHRALCRIDNEKTALHTKTQFRSNIPIFFPFYLIYRVRFYQKKRKTVLSVHFEWRNIPMNRCVQETSWSHIIWKGYLLECTLFLFIRNRFIKKQTLQGQIHQKLKGLPFKI